jgi:hypothetical protein
MRQPIIPPDQSPAQPTGIEPGWLLVVVGAVVVALAQWAGL